MHVYEFVEQQRTQDFDYKNTINLIFESFKAGENELTINTNKDISKKLNRILNFSMEVAGEKAKNNIKEYVNSVESFTINNTNNDYQIKIKFNDKVLNEINQIKTEYMNFINDFKEQNVDIGQGYNAILCYKAWYGLINILEQELSLLDKRIEQSYYKDKDLKKEEEELKNKIEQLNNDNNTIEDIDKNINQSFKELNDDIEDFKKKMKDLKSFMKEIEQKERLKRHINDIGTKDFRKDYINFLYNNNDFLEFHNTKHLRFFIKLIKTQELKEVKQYLQRLGKDKKTLKLTPAEKKLTNKDITDILMDKLKALL